MSIQGSLHWGAEGRGGGVAEPPKAEGQGGGEMPLYFCRGGSSLVLDYK